MRRTLVKAAVLTVVGSAGWLGLVPLSPRNLPVTLSAIAQTTQPARLRSWTYLPNLERLLVDTSGSVRPRLYTLDDPDRIVLDFPNTIWGQPERVQRYFVGKVRSLRISQFDSLTTRIVLDVDPQHPIDANDLKLLTANPERWAVEIQPTAPTTPLATTNLPTPSNPPASTTLGTNSPSPPEASPASPSLPLSKPSLPLLDRSSRPIASPIDELLEPQLPPARVSTSILGIEPTEEGFFIRTDGPVQVSTRRIVDPDRIVVDFLGTDISQMQGSRSLAVHRLGVSALRAGQFEPAIARLVLDVDRSSSDWESTYDPQKKGVRLYPAGGTDVATLKPTLPSHYKGPLATLQAVQLDGNRLEIAADGFLFYRSGWDAETKSYRISVSPAQLPSSLPDPGLTAESPVERIRFVQDSPTTVNILVQPTENFNVRDASPKQGSRQIQLDLVPVESGDTAASNLAEKSTGIVVAIDPGHGGRDPGALGGGGRILEKDIVLTISERVAQLLAEKGYTPILTRTNDREILLQPRIDTAVAADASILLSIHANALDRSDISGIETYYLRPDSARLAEVMHRNMVLGTGASDRRVRRARFFMVRETPSTMPSVLLETGFLTSPTELEKLASPQYQELIAQAIVRGIEEYFGNSP